MALMTPSTVLDGWDGPSPENLQVKSLRPHGRPDPIDDLKNLKSFVVPETVSRPSSLSVDEEFLTIYNSYACAQELK